VDLTTNIYLTRKGEEEIKRGTSELGTRKRSVLMTLLGTSRSLETLLQRTILPQDEFLAEMQSLHQQGFVTTAASERSSVSNSAVLEDGIIISEAKFLLTDFLVDSFGTSSQTYVDAIRASKSISDLQISLDIIHGEVKKRCPDRLSILLKTIQEINSTA
jgi:hypothetical protein